jgi:hypothetical protein
MRIYKFNQFITESYEDMKGKECEVCGKGTYQDESYMDDLKGILHCTNCDEKILRYPQNNSDLVEDTIENVDDNSKLIEQEISDSLVELVDYGYTIDIRPLVTYTKTDLSGYEVLISVEGSGYSTFYPKKIIEPINVLIDYFNDKFSKFRHTLRYVDDYQKYQTLKYRKGGYVIPKDLETICLSLFLYLD